MTNWDFPTVFSHHGEEERRATTRVLASGRMTMAGETEAFETELAQYHGRRHAVMVNSGSSANLIAVAALVNRFDLDVNLQAVVPAIAWATTYSPVFQHGFEDLVVVDVDDTWNAPPIEWNSGRMPPAFLVAVPVLGNPAHLAGWRALADRLGIPLLEDACESMGAWADGIPSARGLKIGNKVGTFGDISTMSFFYSHQLSAWEGGAALTDDDDLARMMRLLRNHGNAGWASDDFESTYDFRLFGYNLRPSELHAAVAREQLMKLPEMIAARRSNSTYFRDLTQNFPITHPRIEGQPSPFGLPFTVASREARRRLVAALRADSIDARLPTGSSFTSHPYGAPWREANPTPNADHIHDTGLFLGVAPYPIPYLIDHAVRIIKETL